MSVRQRMHRLIEELPEERVKSLELILAFAMAEEDDEPEDPEDGVSHDVDWQEYRQGKTLSADEAKRQFLN